MTLPRRRFLRDTAAAALLSRFTAGAATRDPRGTGGLHLASFQFDATPPPGHACCGKESFACRVLGISLCIGCGHRPISNLCANT